MNNTYKNTVWLYEAGNPPCMYLYLKTVVARNLKKKNQNIAADFWK